MAIPFHVLSLPEHIAQILSEDVSFITTHQHALNVEPVEHSPVSSATLQIVSFFFKVDASILVKKESPKDTNFVPTSILKTYNKYLPDQPRTL